MDIISNKKFLSDVSQKAGSFRQKLESLIGQYPEIFNHVRGQGLMLGLKCKVSNMEVVEFAYQENLLLVPAADNTVRLLPSLNIIESELQEALVRLEKAAAAIKKTL